MCTQLTENWWGFVTTSSNHKQPLETLYWTSGHVHVQCKGVQTLGDSMVYVVTACQSTQFGSTRISLKNTFLDFRPAQDGSGWYPSCGTPCEAQCFDSPQCREGVWFQALAIFRMYTNYTICMHTELGKDDSLPEFWSRAKPPKLSTLLSFLVTGPRAWYKCPPTWGFSSVTCWCGDICI